MVAQHPVLLGIAGGSGSGKTYLARRIQQESGGDRVTVLSMDQYFRTLSTAEQHDDPRDINFDHPSHIDFALLHEHLKALRAGETVYAPTYDFRSQLQTPAAIEVKPAPVIVVEGLFILNPPVVELFDLRVFLEVEPDQRLIGRILRDLEEREHDVRWAIDRYQRFVRPGYETFVRPTILNADVVVDFTYRRAFFQELLVRMVREYVTSGFDMWSLIREVKNDRYHPGVQVAREPAPRRGAPPAVECAPATPTLWGADNPVKPGAKE